MPTQNDKMAVVLVKHAGKGNQRAALVTLSAGVGHLVAQVVGSRGFEGQQGG